MATRMRFGTDGLRALGLTADQLTSGGDVASLLAFPAGAKVTSAKADDEGVWVNVSGATFADGAAAAGEVTGTYTVHANGRREFEGFRPVGDLAAEVDAGDAGAGEGA